MVVFNPQKKEIDIKVVYYGPALCGKTTNLKSVHLNLNPHQRGELISLATKDDRTLFFDFLPIQLENIKGFKTRFHIYTVPGQVFYTLTRKAVLTGVDGVIFVADSQNSKMKENIESLNDLKDNLKYYNKTIESIPLVFQYNKRDLPDVAPIAEMNRLLNGTQAPFLEACALSGKGVMETLTMCCRLVLRQLQNRSKAERTVSKTVADAATAAPSSADLPQLTLSDHTQTTSELAAGRGLSHSEAQVVADDIGPIERIDPGDQRTVGGVIHDSISAQSVPAGNTSGQRQQPISASEKMQLRLETSSGEVPVSGEEKIEEGKKVCPRCSLKFKPNVKQCPICRINLIPEHQRPGGQTGISTDLTITRPAIANLEKTAEERPSAPAKFYNGQDQPQLEIVSCNQPLKVSAHTLIIPMIMKINGKDAPLKVELTISFNHAAEQDAHN